MSIILRRIFLLSLLTTQAVAYAGAPVYKWVGVGGVVHYSTVPPLDARAALLDRPPLGVTELKPAVETTVAEGKLKPKEPALDTATKEAFQNCENARDAIRALDSKAPVATLNEKGATVPLDTAGRQAEKTKAGAAVSYWCDKPK